MENNSRKKIKFGSGELSDDDLGQVAGGQVVKENLARMGLTAKQ